MTSPDPADPAGIEVPKLGSVHGFVFAFGQQDLKYPHPGIVVLTHVGMKDGKQRCGVIALAITHAGQKHNWEVKDVLPIPVEELQPMGLDASAHWVCIFEQVVAYFPEGTRWATGSAHLGQASEKFTAQVIEAWRDYRRG